MVTSIEMTNWLWVQHLDYLLRSFIRTLAWTLVTYIYVLVPYHLYISVRYYLSIYNISDYINNDHLSSTLPKISTEVDNLLLINILLLVQINLVMGRFGHEQFLFSFSFIFWLYRDFVFFFFFFSFLLDDEEAHDIEVTLCDVIRPRMW